ncbi:hypothetical protein Tsubulata_013243 [Turnera subulata]|uniref:Uncharacterized protein n=1 Tax=Turnera subulata TaxID=218843 RepID=A0A9Q0FBY5_9ROSI|nr:hypothetical protein Tsubulata_013243 [Turnera subulata]
MEISSEKENPKSSKAKKTNPKQTPKPRPQGRTKLEAAKVFHSKAAKMNEPEKETPTAVEETLLEKKVDEPLDPFEADLQAQKKKEMSATGFKQWSYKGPWPVPTSIPISESSTSLLSMDTPKPGNIYQSVILNLNPISVLPPAHAVTLNTPLVANPFVEKPSIIELASSDHYTPRGQVMQSTNINIIIDSFVSSIKAPPGHDPELFRIKKKEELGNLMSEFIIKDYHSPESFVRELTADVEAAYNKDLHEEVEALEAAAMAKQSVGTVPEMALEMVSNVVPAVVPPMVSVQTTSQPVDKPHTMDLNIAQQEQDDDDVMTDVLKVSKEAVDSTHSFEYVASDNPDESVDIDHETPIKTKTSQNKKKAKVSLKPLKHVKPVTPKKSTGIVFHEPTDIVVSKKPAPKPLTKAGGKRKVGEPEPEPEPEDDEESEDHSSSNSSKSKDAAYQMEGEHEPRPDLSVHGLMQMAQVNQNGLWKEHYFVKVREHEEDIMQLRKHLANYSFKVE